MSKEKKKVEYREVRRFREWEVFIKRLQKKYEGAGQVQSPA